MIDNTREREDIVSRTSVIDTVETCVPDNTARTILINICSLSVPVVPMRRFYPSTFVVRACTRTHRNEY